MRKILKFYIYFVLFILYLPILLLIFYSFIDSENIFILGNFSFDSYKKIFDKDFLKIILNTLLVALISSFFSIILGVFGAVGAFYSKKRIKKIIDFLTTIPIINAEIVTALSLTMFFVFLNYFFNFQCFSFYTLLIGHICLTLPYVYFIVKPKLEQMNKNLYDAATDLGCTPFNFVIKIIVPQIKYDILFCFLLSLILSFDDYIITIFLSGPGLFNKHQSIKTLSTFIQEKIKKGPIPSEAKSLTTIIIFIIFISCLIIKMIKNNKKNNFKISKK